MFRNAKRAGWWIAIAVAIGPVSFSAVLAKKPDKPDEGPSAVELNPAIAFVTDDRGSTLR